MSALLPFSKPVTMDTPSGKKITWGRADQWVLFAGPDSFESEGLVLEIAQELKRITDQLGIPWILKCSFDKANRTSGASFRSLGMDEALKGLARIKSKVGCALVTDVHETIQCERVAEFAEVLQIPAFLCRQTDLLQAAAKTGRVIHVKKGQFMAPWDMSQAVDKCKAAGNDKILLCERGSSFGYNRLVNDMTGLVGMRKFAPVVMDATHSVQLPSGNGGTSGGLREMIPVVARAAMAVGVDGVFMETHPRPDEALVDGPNSLHLKDMPALLEQLQRIWKAVQT